MLGLGGGIGGDSGGQQRSCPGKVVVVVMGCYLQHPITNTQEIGAPFRRLFDCRFSVVPSEIKLVVRCQIDEVTGHGAVFVFYEFGSV